MKLVRAIRNGWIKADKPKEEPRCFLLWGDDTTENERRGLSYIPAPKAKLPGIFSRIIYPIIFLFFLDFFLGNIICPTICIFLYLFHFRA